MTSPREAAIEAAAKELAKAPTIDAPKLEWPCWMGTARAAIEAYERAMAVPVDRWRIVADEPVLVYVVHANAEYEPDENLRRERWEGWHHARWIRHNNGGWMWHGLLGTVTHVAPLPAPPSFDTDKKRG